MGCFNSEDTDTQHLVQRYVIWGPCYEKELGCKAEHVHPSDQFEAMEP